MWTARIEGDYVGATTASIATNSVRPMRFAQLRQVEEGGPATRDFGAASQAGRIDVVARVIESLGDKKLMAAAPGSARGEDAQATGATKKDIFGLGTSYGDAIATAANSSEYGAMRTPRVSRDCFATFSFRYAAIEALHIAKTTPKAWLDRETALIEAARQSSRDLRRHLRAGFAISEPPTYLFSSKLSPLAGPGAPKAVADSTKLDKALRGEGFKLVGEPRSLFDALSHQLCGTHQLSKYVEHVVIEEIERREAGDGHDKKLYPGGEWCGDEYEKLFKPSKSPLREYEDWRDFVASRRAAKGSVRVGAKYDDALALKDDPPPLVAGDLVQVEAVEADEELGEAGEAGYEASVQPSSAQNVVLKPLGAGEVMLKRNDWRLGGGGLATRRGAAVVEMQHAIFLQAFADAFGAVLKSISELDSNCVDL